MSNFVEFGKELRKHRKASKLTQAQLAELIGVEKRTIGRYEKGQIKRVTIDFINRVLNVIDNDELLKAYYKYIVFYDTGDKFAEFYSDNEDFVEIKVYGSVPAGIPIEAIEDQRDVILIPKSWTKGGKEFIGLEVQGDSMFPKYLPGDTVVVEITPDFETGQDVIVYVNGYEATLKTIQKNTNGTVSLVPINSMYPTMTYGPDDEPISVLGIVRELRRPI